VGEPYYSDEFVTIYHGDCREFGLLGDVTVTDPPYGIGYRTPPSAKRPKSGDTVEGDEEPFDPSHLLSDRPTVLWGAHHYADRLPSSPGWIVWDKREGMPPNDQGDADLAWTNFLGAVRTIRVLWNGGGSLLAENGPARSIHPTQKPLRLLVKTLLMCPPGVVFDPYVGTGTGLVAAKNLSRKAIGIELKERYCEIAANRCSQGVLALGS